MNRLSRGSSPDAQIAATTWAKCVVHGLSIPPGTDDCGGGEAGTCRTAAYDFERHEWNPQCPHGDICTGCDARGYCTRMEDRDPRRRRVSGLPERPAIASEGRQATLCPYVTSGTGAKTPLNCVYEKGHAGEHVYA